MPHNLSWVLSSIGGWHVGCQNEVENIDAVSYAKDHGFVTIRIHYAPAIPDGSIAYELTDAGFDELAKMSDLETVERALRARRWYRNNARKHLECRLLNPATSTPLDIHLTPAS